LQTEDALRKLFNDIDTDGNGTLDLKEFTEGLAGKVNFFTPPPKRGGERRRRSLFTIVIASNCLDSLELQDVPTREMHIFHHLSVCICVCVTHVRACARAIFPHARACARAIFVHSLCDVSAGLDLFLRAVSSFKSIGENMVRHQRQGMGM
jgi:hypothetical protein